MNNLKAIERFEQTNSAQINKLFWIAGSIESHDLASFLEDLDSANWKECLPEIFEDSNFEECMEDEEFNELLIDHNKLGFIAEVTFPESYNFKYDGDKLTGWSSNGGTRRIKYVYAETTDELLSAIEKVGEEVFEDYKKADKQKKLKATNNAEA